MAHKKEAEGKMSGNLESVSGQLLHFMQEISVAVSTSARDSLPSICRVPSDLLEGHEKYTMPKTVSIGPFHAHGIRLSSADEQKRAYLKGFLSSFPQGTTAEQLIQKLTEPEEKSVGDSTDQQLKTFLKGFVSRFSQDTTIEQLVQEMMKPEAVALGHKDKSLSSADQLKQGFFNKFLARFSANQAVKGDIIDILMNREQEARQYYEGEISLSSYEFLKMMLLDGCFIIELLLWEDWQNINMDNIVMARGRFPLYTCQQDLLKLENQMPFFILSDLYDLVYKNTNISTSKNQSLVGSAINFFKITVPHKLRSPEIENKEIKHLLHLMKMALFQSSLTNKEVNMPNPNSTPSKLPKNIGASELESSYGVVFAKVEDVSLSQIEFSNGVLTIPQLVFEESTAPLFFNLLVSELCSQEYGKGLFTSYVIFMDGLISNEKDVKVLLRSEIFKARTNDIKALVSFFNGLSMNLITSREQFHFGKILVDVNKYCNSGLRPIRAYLMNNYYEARWDVLNSFLLSVLTITQTPFSGLSYNLQTKQKKKPNFTVGRGR